jgi:uncharacterized protein
MDLISNKRNMIKLESWVKRLFNTLPVTAHGWLHTTRVQRLSEIIAEAEGVDQFLATCAALLHDIGRTLPGPEAEHGRRSADLAAPFLQELHLTDEERCEILHAIRWHNSGRDDTKLLCVVRDADMLDALGAIGVMRACASRAHLPLYNGDSPFDGEFQRESRWVSDQIQYQLSFEKWLNTATGKKMAKRRIRFMGCFIKQSKRELGESS